MRIFLIVLLLFLVGCEDDYTQLREQYDNLTEHYAVCQQRRQNYYQLLRVTGYFEGTGLEDGDVDSPVVSNKICRDSSLGFEMVRSMILQGNTTFAFTSTPKLANMDGVIGLASGNVTGYSDIAAIVRFNPAGFIDIRNGDAYSATVPYAYQPDTMYEFNLTINVPQHTYTVAVTVDGERSVLLTDAQFREGQQNVTELVSFVQQAAVGSMRTCVENVVE